MNFDPRTGEVLEEAAPHEIDCPHWIGISLGIEERENDRLRKVNRDLEDQMRGAEKALRSASMRYADLARDKEREAKENPLWDDAKELFDHWREACNHKRGPFTYDRFAAIEPFLKRDGYEMCKLAIDGAAFDPWAVTRKNGSTKRFDDWTKHIFTDRSKFEDMCNRAPVERQQEALAASKQKKGRKATASDPPEQEALRV